MATTNSNGLRRFGRRVAPGASRWFLAATEQLETGARVVSVMGEVDVATAPALEQALHESVDEGSDEVIVDLTGCTFLDSAGLRALLAARGRLEHSDQRLPLVMSSPSVMRIFQITHFDEQCEIYPTVTAAANGGVR
jgi:anti-sigma B factor antagonist